MSKTAFATSDVGVKKLYEEKLWRDSLIESFFNKFESNDGMSIGQVKRDLEKSQGDLVNFYIRYTPTGVGVGPGTALEGNEDSLKIAGNSVVLTRRRNAFRDDGELSRQRAVFSIDVESEAAIKEWATEWIDREKFYLLTHGILYSSALGGSANVAPTKAFYAGSATSTATLTSSDLLTPGLISRVRTWARQTNNHARVALRPLNIKGRSFYVCLIHPDVAYDLKRNSEYLQNLRECLDRSPDHPIFTGALGVSHDGVVFHEHERVEIQTDGGAGSNVNYAQNLFLGKQAFCWAWGQDMMSLTRKKFDYDEEHGYAVAMTYGGTKSKFTKPGEAAADFGSVAIFTARTAITDA